METRRAGRKPSRLDDAHLEIVSLRAMNDQPAYTATAFPRRRRAEDRMAPCTERKANRRQNADDGVRRYRTDKRRGR
jgi:hypothetical protein